MLASCWWQHVGELLFLTQCWGFVRCQKIKGFVRWLRKCLQRGRMLRKLSFSLSTGIFFLTEEPDKKKSSRKRVLNTFLTYHISWNFLGFLRISRNSLEFLWISWNFPSSPPSTGFSKHKKTNLAREYSLS